MAEEKPNQGTRKWWIGLIVAVVLAAFGYLTNSCTPQQEELQRADAGVPPAAPPTGPPSEQPPEVK